MSGMIAFMIAPLIVWAGLFFYLLSIDKQVKDLKK
jgi:CcmD family protein